MDHLDKQDFEKIKSRAETLYKSVVKIRCPALGEDVHFTSDGFHHLQYDGSRAERTKAVQKNKMFCLQFAIDIIKKTTTIQEFRSSLCAVGKPDKNGFRKTKMVQYYAFEAITDLPKQKRVKVVVRRVGDGNAHFWSVMPSWQEEQINDSQTVRRIGKQSIEDG